MILVIDNYDSFTFNLVQCFGQLGVEQRVFRNDEITLEGIAARQPDRLVISPGPGRPERRAEGLFQPIVGNGLSAAGPPDGHAFAVDRMAGDRRVDRALLRIGTPPDQRLVDPGQVVGGKQLRQRDMGRIVLGHDHDARRLLVEPVHDARSAHAADPREAVAAMGEQCIDQRVVGIAGCRMHHETGRLVQDQQVGVFIEDVQIELLRLGLSGLGRRHVEQVALALFDLAGWLFYRRPGLAVGASQRHAAAFDQRLHATAREVRQRCRQRTVEAFAGHAVVDGHDVALRFAHGVNLAPPSSSQAPSSQAASAQVGAPLWLKVLVIVMGLLIVVGFIVVAAEIARRMSNASSAAPPAVVTKAFAQRIALPSGARVVSMQAAGDQLIVHVEAQGGTASAYMVDPRTGHVALIDYMATEDVGRIINPLTLHGQTVGAIVQGLGGALLENLLYDSEGQFLSGSLADYLLPTASDFPNLRGVVLDDYPSPINPLGAKGAGEGGIIAAGGCMANAVANALQSFGVEPRELPLSPGYIWGLVQAGRMESPKFLAGESYGGFRGPRLARSKSRPNAWATSPCPEDPWPPLWRPLACLGWSSSQQTWDPPAPW